jgi:protein-S-isoprenylcysteine O-methyltransferase Ste14
MELKRSEQIKNLILTIIQYSMLLTFIVSGPLLAKNLIFLLLELLGIFLGIWAILSMKKSKIHIAPKPRTGSILIVSGPYKWVRHPMYLAILLAFLPLLFDQFSQIRSVILVALTVNLIFKLNFEESLLKRHFQDYEAYSLKSWKLIPWIY